MLQITALLQYWTYPFFIFCRSNKFCLIFVSILALSVTYLSWKLSKGYPILRVLLIVAYFYLGIQFFEHIIFDFILRINFKWFFNPIEKLTNQFVEEYFLLTITYMLFLILSTYLKRKILGYT